MALNWYVKDVRPDLKAESPERKAWWDAIDWDMFQSLSFQTMAVGINNIKDVFVAQEFYRRHVMYYKAMGHEPFLTLEFIYEFVGFGTNASTKTLTQFKKDIFEHLSRDADYKLKAAVNDYAAKPHGTKD